MLDKPCDICGRWFCMCWINKKYYRKEHSSDKNKIQEDTKMTTEVTKQTCKCGETRALVRMGRGYYLCKKCKSIANKKRVETMVQTFINAQKTAPRKKKDELFKVGDKVRVNTWDKHMYVEIYNIIPKGDDLFITGKNNNEEIMLYQLPLKSIEYYVENTKPVLPNIAGREVTQEDLRTLILWAQWVDRNNG